MKIKTHQDNLVDLLNLKCFPMKCTVIQKMISLKINQLSSSSLIPEVSYLLQLNLKTQIK